MIVGDLSPSLESPEQVIVELSAGWRTDDGALSDTLLGESKKKSQVQMAGKYSGEYALDFASFHFEKLCKKLRLR